MNYHQRSLKIREKQCDNNSLKIAASKVNIAGIYFQLKEYKKADKLYHEVGEIYNNNPQTPQLSKAQNYNNLAGVAYMQKQYDKALTMFEQALAIYTRVLGSSHPDTRKAARNLQVVRQKLETLNQ